MQVKLKSGKMLDLSEEEIKEMLHMYKDWSENSFDAEKLEKYFEEMRSKSETNMTMISESENNSEKEIKHSLANVFKYGTEKEVADYIIEAIEFMISNMILESMK